MRAKPSRFMIAIRTSLASGLYFTAFSTRFSRACSIRQRDPTALVGLAARDVARELDEVDRLALPHKLALLEARRIEQLDDQCREPSGLEHDPPDPGDIGRRRGLGDGTPLQELGLRNESRERRLQVVSGRRDEVLLETRRLLVGPDARGLVDQAAAFENDGRLIRE